MEYGGAHVIEDLIAGRKVRLKATSYGTDCYPRRALEAWITKDSINEAYMFNPPATATRITGRRPIPRTALFIRTWEHSCPTLGM